MTLHEKAERQAERLKRVALWWCIDCDERIASFDDARAHDSKHWVAAIPTSALRAAQSSALREAADQAVSALHPVEGMVSVHDVIYWLRDRADAITREGQE